MISTNPTMAAHDAAANKRAKHALIARFLLILAFAAAFLFVPLIGSIP